MRANPTYIVLLHSLIYMPSDGLAFSIESSCLLYYQLYNSYIIMLLGSDTEESEEELSGKFQAK